MQEALASKPALEPANAPLAMDPKPGARIAIVPDDYGRDPVEGDLVSIGPDHVTIRHEPAEAGVLRVHFPRWGYRVIPA